MINDDYTNTSLLIVTGVTTAGNTSMTSMQERIT
jgi:hypothetical protein